MDEIQTRSTVSDVIRCGNVLVSAAASAKTGGFGQYSSITGCGHAADINTIAAE